MNKEFIKSVLVGDSNVGKTCFLISCIAPQDVCFTQDMYIPEIFDGCTVHVKFENQIIPYEPWDTDGKKYEKLRPYSYPDTDVFLLCFSLVSLKNIRDIYIPEIKKCCPSAVYILVGMKSDL